MGYYGVFLGMQYHNDIAMVKILDNDQYNDSQAITIKIPVSIPYMPDQTDFKRKDGKFQYEGEHYRFVKQKYAKDTLTIICIRDYKHERIDQALSNYVQTFSDNGADHTRSKITLSFIKDFLPHTFSLLTLTSGWQSDVIKNGFSNQLTPTFTSSVIHPPERA